MNMESVVDRLENDFGKQVEFRRIDAGTQDGQAVFRAYGLQGHPSYVMVDPSGEVLWTGLGEQSAETLKSQIKLVLGANPD
ncbi:MAG: hypothetical protein MUO67_03590 [Anaerolineales bacterium]|nr:hypothetical protein [Anaerolineales bacterium]